VQRLPDRRGRRSEVQSGLVSDHWEAVPAHRVSANGPDRARRLTIGWPLCSGGTRGCPTTGHLDARVSAPDPRLIVSGWFTDSPIRMALPIFRELTILRIPAFLDRWSGDLSLLPCSDFRIREWLGLFWPAGSHGIKHLLSKTGASLCLSDRARSMLQREHRVPKGAFAVFGCFRLVWARHAGND